MRRFWAVLTLLAAGMTGAPTLAAGLQSTASGAQLYVDCRGEKTAAPTVILEAGAFGISADWDLLLEDLSKGGRVCAYDRGGLGRSPPRAGGEDVLAVTQELADLLDGMGETGPVILVGHSNGALYAETFAARWPGRVAGLVYINGVGSDVLDHKILMAALDDERRVAGLSVVAAHLGLAPIVACFVTRHEGLKGEAAERKRESLTSLTSLRVARDEDRAITPGLSVTRRLGGSPPSAPTVVVVESNRADLLASFGWRAAETAPAERARQGWILRIIGATHVSPLGPHRAFVVAAVTWLRSLPVTAP